MARSWVYTFMADWKTERSERRFESLLRRSISAGLRVKTTTTERIAMMAITTSNSMRVNPSLGEA
jgi:hypothetical protein